MNDVDDNFAEKNRAEALAHLSEAMRLLEAIDDQHSCARLALAIDSVNATPITSAKTQNHHRPPPANNR